MVYTSEYPLTIDGVRLDTLAWNVETLGGRDYVPSIRDENISLPGRHGNVFVPGKRFDQGKMILKMWVIRADADGEVTTNSFNEFRRNMDALKVLFTRRARLLDLRREDGSGLQRQAYAEVLSAIDPDHFGANPGARFSVELEIPAVFWQDLQDSNLIATGLQVSPTTDIVAEEFAGATAPMEDLWIVVDGPANKPIVTDVESGHYIKLNETLVVGKQWVVDTTNWTSRVGTATAFTSGGTEKIEETIFSGQHSPRLFAMSPPRTSSEGPSLQFSTDIGGTTDDTKLRIRGKRKFL